MFQAMAGSQRTRQGQPGQHSEARQDPRDGRRAQDAGGGPGPRGENAREVLALRNLVAVYRHLSGLAVQNADIAAVTQLIAEQTHATVAIVSPTMDILAAAAPGETAERAAQYVRDLVIHPRLGDVLGAASRARRALRLPDVGTAASVIVAPVLVGDDVPAYLLTLNSGGERTGEDTSLLLTEHAATICGVILGRERVVAAAASRIRDDLVEGLLSGHARDPAETGRWARHLGYDPGHEHYVLSIALDAARPPAARSAAHPAAAHPAAGHAAPVPAAPGEAAMVLTRRAASSAGDFLATRAPDAIISVRDSEVAMVLPGNGDAGAAARARKLGGLCVGRLGELFPEVAATAGIGGPCHDPGEIRLAYAQARRTVETVRRMGRAGRVVAFGDLGIHRLLLQVPDLAELRGFAHEVLGRLSGDDGDQAQVYLATLACYFRENASPQRASQVLHVHPNTVTYRIRRVEEITGLDLGSYRDRLMAQVALEILDAVGEGP
jgi:PucR family transcriptional regulator, purine catabolism regulatory protein